MKDRSGEDRLRTGSPEINVCTLTGSNRVVINLVRRPF
jgi:hypothetical protein